MTSAGLSADKPGTQHPECATAGLVPPCGAATLVDSHAHEERLQ